MMGAAAALHAWHLLASEPMSVLFPCRRTDRIRMCVAKDELESLINHPDMRSVPVLFFANKMDLPTALTPVECVNQLELDTITDKPWHIAASNAISGEGLEEGITWLSEQMSRQQKR